MCFVKVTERCKMTKGVSYDTFGGEVGGGEKIGERVFRKNNCDKVFFSVRRHRLG